MKITLNKLKQVSKTTIKLTGTRQGNPFLTLLFMENNSKIKKEYISIIRN